MLTFSPCGCSASVGRRRASRGASFSQAAAVCWQRWGSARRDLAQAMGHNSQWRRVQQSTVVPVVAVVVRGAVGHVGSNDMRWTCSSAGQITEGAGGEAPACIGTTLSADRAPLSTSSGTLWTGTRCILTTTAATYLLLLLTHLFSLYFAPLSAFPVSHSPQTS